MPDERFNEDSSIREVLNYLGLDENFIPVTPDHVQRIIPEVVEYSDEPLATPNCVLHGILARAINSAGVNVVLNGVGGDEVFISAQSDVEDAEKALACIIALTEQHASSTGGNSDSRYR